MFPEPKDIRSLADEIWNSSEDVIKLDRWLSQKLRTDFNLDNLSICEILDELKAKIDALIERKISNYRNRYLPPKYKFDDFLSNTLVVTPELKKEPNLSFLRQVSSQIRVAISKMSWRKLEYLGKYLLEISGASVAEVTRATKEGGIDFYGVFEYPTNRVFLKDLKIRVVGQAKHSATNAKVGENAVRNFVKHYEEFQAKSGMATKVLPPWFINMKAPILGVMITNTDFKRNVRSYAEQNGIITREGDQIIEDIIHSPRSKNWIDKDKGGRLIFDSESFLHSF
ncbi:hypothetical protein ES707_03448 [subsurface metagenome]